MTADASASDATVTVDKLFTFENSTATDYNFAVTPAVAGVSVAANGTVTVLSATTTATSATIKATNKTESGVTASKVITIKPKPPAPTVSAVAGVVTADASSADATVTVDKLFKFGNSTATDYTYAVTPPVTGVSVAANGTVTVLNETTTDTSATIKATNKTTSSVTATKEIAITPKS